MTKRTEQVGADQIGDAAWQERGALFETINLIRLSAYEVKYIVNRSH